MYKDSLSKKLKNLGKKILIFVISLVFIFGGRQMVFAYNFAEESGLNETASQAGYDYSKTQTPEYWVGQIIQIILSFLGVIFLALMIYAGFSWMTAAGNEQKAEKAKNIIVESIIGLIIVIGAYAITYFISSYTSTVY